MSASERVRAPEGERVIAIVGGGVTGLAIAQQLGAAGVDYQLFEASGRVGGVIRSARVDGHVLDQGPQRARLTPAFQARVRALGLEDDLITAPPGLGLLIHRNGSLAPVPFSLRALLTGDTVSCTARARILLEPLTAGPKHGERVGPFFRRKVGREVYQTLIAPLFGGLYGSDPDEMDVEAVLAPVLGRLGVKRSLVARLLAARRSAEKLPLPCTFRNGMEQMTDRMGRTLGDTVRLHAPVTGVEPAGAGFRIVIDHGRERIDAEHVVFTAPASATGAALASLDPGASAKISGLRYNPLAVVHLTADLDVEAMGFQVAHERPARELRGVTFQNALFGRERLYTAFLGGALSRAIVDEADGAVAHTAIREFRRTTGAPADVVSVHRTAMPAWDVTWRGLDDLTLPPGLHLAGNWYGRPGLPGRFAEAAALTDMILGAPRSRRPVAQTPS